MRRISIRTVLVVSMLGIGASLGGSLPPALAQAPKPKQGKPAAIEKRGPLAETISERNAKRLETLGGELKGNAGREVVAEACAVLDWTAAYADPVKDAAAFREAALGARAAKQVMALAPDARQAAVATLRNCPALAASLLMLVDDAKGGDDVKGVYDVLLRLTKAFGEKTLDNYPDLAAAVCVVHDAPLIERVNENRVSAASPEEIFGYFMANEKRMRFGIKGIPGEVLVYVVNVCAPISEMKWALDRYAKSQIAPLYGQINYDSEHLAGSEKRLTRAGFSLPNILKHGGVCIDQAYFAATVGKSCGVPSVVCTGSDDTVAHAWLGTLVQARGGVAWDFDTGRYPEYKNVRGSTADPRSRVSIPDGYLMILTEGMKDPVQERRTALALTDAAERMVNRTAASGKYPPEPALLGESCSPAAEVTARTPSLETALALLEAGVRLCPAEVSAWNAFAQLARGPEMTTAQRSKWAGAVDELCGRRAPDFAFMMYAALVSGVKVDADRARLWEKLAPMFKQRPDLEASARLRAAGDWEKSGDKARSWDTYQKIVSDFADDGPAILPALAQSEKMLREAGKVNEIVPMYERAWRKMQKPGGLGGPFATQSNWYRVGSGLERAARSVGNANRADQVVRQLSVGG